jgi:hypothetical protein
MKVTSGSRRFTPDRPFHHRVWALMSVLLGVLMVCGLRAEPTEMRDWIAKSGHKLQAKALQIKAGQVQFERPDGSRIVVALDKLGQADQDFLKEHFDTGEDSTNTDAKTDGKAPEGEPATDLPHPLGKTTDEIPCGGGFDCFIHLPNSLRRGAKHPVVFVMNPGGGGKGTADRYIPGAERNRWIIAVSKQSKNGFEGSQAAVDAMIGQVTTSLPIDPKRMYVSGFSGGSRMAFATAQKHKDIAGVIACGAGGDIGGSKQTVYGLCGSNCFNRTDMSNSFRTFKGRDHLLRFFAGQHAWADAELCDDAITHLNGVFLTANKAKYPEEFAFHVRQVTTLVKDSEKAAPLRALMWASFLSERNAAGTDVASIRAALAADPLNTLYLKGLSDVSKFAQNTFGAIPASQWKADPKAAAACKREAAKYAGTPWEEILNKMAEDAQKF